jgi:hypothetical protein
MMPHYLVVGVSRGPYLTLKVPNHQLLGPVGKISGKKKAHVRRWLGPMGPRCCVSSFQFYARAAYYIAKSDRPHWHTRFLGSPPWYILCLSLPIGGRSRQNNTPQTKSQLALYEKHRSRLFATTSLMRLLLLHLCHDEVACNKGLMS